LENVLAKSRKLNYGFFCVVILGQNKPHTMP